MVQSWFKAKTKQIIQRHLCIMLYDNSSVPPGSFSFMIFKVVMNSPSSVNTIHENSESPTFVQQKANQVLHVSSAAKDPHTDDTTYGTVQCSRTSSHHTGSLI